MIFRTKLDRPVTYNTARQRVDTAYEIPDNMSRLGAAVEGLNPPKDRRLVPIPSPAIGLHLSTILASFILRTFWCHTQKYLKI